MERFFALSRTERLKMENEWFGSEIERFGPKWERTIFALTSNSESRTLSALLHIEKL